MSNEAWASSLRRALERRLAVRFGEIRYSSLTLKKPKKKLKCGSKTTKSSLSRTTLWKRFFGNTLGLLSSNTVSTKRHILQMRISVS